MLENVAAELQRPRGVSAQVMRHLVETYGIDREAVGLFLVNELPKLEDYEIDLILSPIFTPTLDDQAIFAEFLGRDSIPRDQWPAIVHQLAARPTRTLLTTEDGREHLVPLRTVTIERFVHRLRLDAAIPDWLFDQINHLPASVDRPRMKAIARRAVWENASRREILGRHLAAGASSDSYLLEDALELLRLVETYQPDNLADLLGRIPHWQHALRQEINTFTTAKPFFNERVQEMHGGGRDQRRQDYGRITAKELELQTLERLQRVLST